MDLPTRADLFEIGRADILARSAARPPGSRITPEEVDTEGSDINIILSSTSAMGDEVLRRTALRLAEMLLDSAEGEALDRWIADRFSGELVRKGASPSVVTLSFTQDAAGPARVFSVGDKMRAPGGIEFELTSIATLGAAAVGPVTATAEASLTGVQATSPLGPSRSSSRPRTRAWPSRTRT